MIEKYPRKVKIFYCYASKDEEYQVELEKHLATLRRLARITTRLSREILPGAEWKKEINRELSTADIILLLISSDFINSDYCYNEEMEQALARQRAGEAHVIPVLLRPVDFQDTPIARLQYLPMGGKPVSCWLNRDEAYENIARGIWVVVKKLYGQNTHERYIDEDNDYSDSLLLDVIPMPYVKRNTETRYGKTKQQWLDEGNTYYKENMYEAAFAASEIAIQIDPEDDIAYWLKANSLRKLGLNVPAYVAYDRAISLNPKVSAYYHNKALSLWNLGDYDEALKAFNQAIFLNPVDTLSYKCKAELLVQRKRFTEALFVFDQIINLEPYNATTYRNKENILWLLHRYKELPAVYDQLILLEPNDHVNYLNKAKALFHAGNYYQMLIAYHSYCDAWTNKELIKLRKRFMNFPIFVQINGKMLKWRESMNL